MSAKKNSSKKIGGHVSTAGNFYKAAKRAADIKANCAQIFSSSPRVWQRGWEDKLEADQYFAAMKEHQIEPVYTHALYLVNLASEKSEQVEKSVAALKKELEFDSAINGAGVVVHLGSHMGNGWDAVREQVAEAITKVLADTPDDSTFLIEDSAGQSGKVCSNLAEIRWLLDTIDADRLGWCVDTCHAFAAGYSLGEDNGAEHQNFADQPENLIAAIDSLNLWDSLQCVHVNDSKGAFGSGTDRHENLLDGEIPEDDFAYFLNYEQMADLPLILEVPGIEGDGPDAENIARLKQLVGEK